MADAPLVSVVVPTLNRARFLPATLDSILQQDYPNIACIVVDGGSTDGTAEVMARYAGRVAYVSRPDRGAFDAINDGWRDSKGEILAWLNADDTWQTPHAVSAAVRYMQAHPGVDVVYGDCGGIDIDGNMVWYGAAEPWDLRHAILDCHPILNQPAAFLRREMVERVGFLYPAWCHDHDLWVRIGLAGGKFAALPQHLGNARLWGSNLHLKPSLVIPAKIQLTRRILAHPALPGDLKRKKGRILSNAYLRCLDFLPRPADWGWGLYVLARAFIAAPANTPRIIEQVAVHVAWLIPSLRNRLRKRYGHGVEVEPGSPPPAVARGAT
jgi:glycosyltransferase involved in cell wall biosynthesis